MGTAPCPNLVIGVCAGDGLSDTSAIPLYILDCHGGLCGNCDIIYGKWQGGKGKLEAVAETECPVCLETKPGVVWPKCSHPTCATCFRRCWFGDEAMIEAKRESTEPSFPYDSETEDEYYDNPKETKWVGDEAIAKYGRDSATWIEWWEKWLEEQRPASGAACPLCRAK